MPNVIPEPSVPAPVTLDVTEGDLEAMRADFLAHCHGVPRPWFLGIGIAYVALGLFDVITHRELWWFWVLAGALLILGSTRAGKRFPSAVRATEVRFAEQGLDFDVAFENVPRRYYSWGGIRAINDTGEVFVLVPQFGKRLVLPKRAFPDGGREAWAFFAAHGVAGRTPAATVVRP
jgi:hypothetical protein